MMIRKWKMPKRNLPEAVAQERVRAEVKARVKVQMIKQHHIDDPIDFFY